jgi:hypothetical protein
MGYISPFHARRKTSGSKSCGGMLLNGLQLTYVDMWQEACFFSECRTYSAANMIACSKNKSRKVKREALS